MLCRINTAVEMRSISLELTSCVGLQSVSQHKDIVTTLALGEDGRTLVRAPNSIRTNVLKKRKFAHLHFRVAILGTCSGHW